MPQTKTMTGPLAIIKVQGVAVGKMKSIRCTESVRFGKTVGLGRMAPDEMMPLDWSGTLNCGAFLIDLSVPVIPGAFNRLAQTADQFFDTMLLNSDGVQIDIMRKVYGSTNSQGIILPKFVVLVSIKMAFATREIFDISEGQISGRDIDFEYMTPFLFPI